MHVARPTDVLELQRRTVEWMSGSQGNRFLATWSNDVNKKSHGRMFTHPDGPEYFATMVTLGLRTAPAYFIERNIINHLWQFADDFVTGPVTSDDLPTPTGFAVLDEPLLITDIRGAVMATNAVQWRQTRNGVFVLGYTFPEDEYDEWNGWMNDDERRDDARRLRIPMFLSWHRAWRFGEPFERPASAIEQGWVEVEAETKPGGLYDSPYEFGLPITYETYTQSFHDSERVDRFILAFWHFVQEKLPALERPYRALARRCERSGMTAAMSGVHVVDLRAIESQSATDADTKEFRRWSSRWKVRSHPRRQWYPREGVHRVIQIPAHVKGPADLPLIEKPSTVYRVRR